LNIYINRKPVDGPWGGGNNFVKAMYSQIPINGHKILDNPLTEMHTPDIIFLQSPKHDSVCQFSINDAIFLKNKYPSTKIAMRVNECDARKGTSGVDNLWIECSNFVDITFFVSSWMKSYFLEKGWKCKNNFVVRNGVNLDHFKKMPKIGNDKINIVTHHWSNNRMKGFDIYEELDNYIDDSKKITFTYIGRELGTFKNTKIVKPLFGEELGSELGRYDVYVSASKFDPGPNHILESLACEIPTYVQVDGGGCVEFAGNSHTFKDFKDFISIVNNGNIVKNNKHVVSWETCVSDYLDVLQDFI
jgi:hypothetical protein